jgi:NADH-ubiquinone oxidoreductase chain 2
MTFVAIITSVISASYYLRIIVLLVTSTITLSDKEKVINKEDSINVIDLSNLYNNDTILTNLHSFLISTITLSILLFILKPNLLLNSTQLLSLSYFNS